MPLPLGLLEERELDARQRLEECREEAERAREAVAAAERAHGRAVIARGELAAALEVAGEAAGRSRGAEKTVPPGTVLPVRGEGVSVLVLAPDYQRILVLLDDVAPQPPWPPQRQHPRS